MSRNSYKIDSYLNSTLNPKINSINQLRSDFKNITINMGKFYDTRIYFDGNDEYYPYMFSKTLQHNSETGFAKKKDIDTIIKASQISDISSINNIATSDIPSENRRIIEGVASSQSYNLMGTDSCIPIYSDYYKIDDPRSMFEMGEVYSMQLLKDETFYDIENNVNNINKYHLSDLNSFEKNITAPTDNSKITSKLLFRGNNKHELIGPYISQYLYLPFNYGSIPIEQKFTSIIAQDINDSKWIEIQNGKIIKNVHDNNVKYINTPKILATKVHTDPLFQFYYNAAIISFQNNIKPSGFNNGKSSIWTSSGPPDIFASVAHVALGTLRSAWFNKYNIAMRIRPEVFAQRINLIKNEKNNIYIDRVPGFKNINNNMQNINNILSQVHGKQMNYHLKTLYTEGSPTHPSWPAGHACVAGACVTVLKAMLDTHEIDGNPKKWPMCKFNTHSGSDNGICHSIDGNNLVKYKMDNSQQLTIVGELNKLASNVSIGRNFAGVHYRCDSISGISLGEQYAITYLIDKAKEYNESYNKMFNHFFLEKFDGSKIKITSSGIINDSN